MEELSRTIRMAGLDPVMAPASGQMLRSIGDLDLRSAIRMRTKPDGIWPLLWRYCRQAW